MNQFKLIIIFFLLFFLSGMYAQTNFLSIEGIYRQPDTSFGLEVKKTTNGNYIFTYIVIQENGEISPHEWKSAYVIAPANSRYLFYWHTGRYNDIYGTNGIIVYDLIYDGRKLCGTYFFP